MTAIPDRVSAESTAPIRPGAMATPRGAPVVRRRHPHGRVRRPGASIAAATVAFVVGMGGVVIGLRSTHAFRAATDWAIDLPNVRLAVTWLDDPSRLPFLHCANRPCTTRIRLGAMGRLALARSLCGRTRPSVGTDHHEWVVVTSATGNSGLGPDDRGVAHDAHDAVPGLAAQPVTD